MHTKHKALDSSEGHRKLTKCRVLMELASYNLYWTYNLEMIRFFLRICGRQV
jgi:hypothetical protein